MNSQRRSQPSRRKLGTKGWNLNERCPTPDRSEILLGFDECYFREEAAGRTIRIPTQWAAAEFGAAFKRQDVCCLVGCLYLFFFKREKPDELFGIGEITKN